MSNDDSTEANATSDSEARSTEEHSATVSESQAAYNVISDTVVGVNVRGSDNKFQAIFVLVSVLICSAVMIVLAMINDQWNLPLIGAALIGVFVGLIAGVFLSGTYLMIYRAKRHLQGKHD